MRFLIRLAIPVSIFASIAQDPAIAQKPTVTRGAGALSCGAYVQAYDVYRPFAGGNDAGLIASQATSNYAQFEAWIQGYLVGVDSWNKHQIKNFDRAAMQVWVYTYCQKHPVDIVANAALAFYRELGGPIPTGGDRPKSD